MKNKILALLATIGLASSVTAVEINDNLSINGFIDGSYVHTDNDTGTDDQQLGADEVELNFITNVGNVDGVLNIDSNDGVSELDVEQAHITYSLDNGVSFTFGKYGSALGFEREDPTSLYTYSRAYGGDNIADNDNDDKFNLGHVDANVVEGFTVAYSNDVFGVGVSFENDLNTNADDDELNIEVALSYTGLENVNLGIGYFFDNQTNPDEETDVLNVHASTNLGKLFLAAEYTEMDRAGGNTDLDGYLFLADYDFNDKIGAAFRISNNEKASGGDYDKVTIAPNYAITDSLGAILEYSDIDDAGVDQNILAVELLYTF